MVTTVCKEKNRNYENLRNTVILTIFLAVFSDEYAYDQKFLISKSAWFAHIKLRKFEKAIFENNLSLYERDFSKSKREDLIKRVQALTGNQTLKNIAVTDSYLYSFILANKEKLDSFYYLVAMITDQKLSIIESAVFYAYTIYNSSINEGINICDIVEKIVLKVLNAKDVAFHEEDYREDVFVDSIISTTYLTKTSKN